MTFTRNVEALGLNDSFLETRSHCFTSGSTTSEKEGIEPAVALSSSRTLGDVAPSPQAE